MLRLAAATDAEEIFQLLFCARDEIPLTMIEQDQKDKWLEFVRLRCNLNHSWVAEQDGKIVSAMLVGARMQSSENVFREPGEPPKEWELLYSTTDKEHRQQGLCKALYRKSVEPFETVYAQVKTDNKSNMGETLRRWGFKEIGRPNNQTIEFMLTRGLSKQSKIDEKAVSNDTATEILGNAIRLYADAKLLFTHERYATCTSLSVLSIEELAKFLALVGLQPLPLKEWRSHNAKHVSSASFLLRKSYQTALSDVLAEVPPDERDATYSRLANMDYCREEMSLFDAVLAKLVENSSLTRFSQAYMKDLDRLKQSGLYTDTDDMMKVRSSPTDITREVAANSLQFVREVLETIRSHI
ncbi:MAG: AbiV family abortive infection protein [Methylovirgula sp.]